MKGTVSTLDYPDAEILMNVSSEVENTKRIGACEKERETVEWIETFPADSVFYDIGACVGAYSLVAASRQIHTFAFEPAYMNYFRLVSNLRLNEKIRTFVTPMPYLLAARTQMVPFHYSSVEFGAAEHNENGSVFSQAMGGWALDDLVTHLKLPWPDYLKIDVDGLEDQVIAGASKTLESCSELQVEIDDSKPDCKRRVQSMMMRLGFETVVSTRHGSGPISNVRYRRL